MSSQDYLDGLRDGFNIGFKTGIRKGVEIGQRSGYLSGYKDGYDDSSLGLPYKPIERFNEFKLDMPKLDPLPKYEYEPVIPNYGPPKIEIDPLPKFEFNHTLPKYELPEIKVDPLPKYEPPKYDFFDNLSSRNFWEKD